MPICANCGVEIEEGLKRCPLCLSLLGGERENMVEESPRARIAPPPAGQAGPLTLLRLWEIVSLFAAISAVVVFAADFAYSMCVTWARYPLASIVFLWAAGSLLILIRTHKLLLLTAETALSAIFLQVLDLLMPEDPWFFPLALPITVVTGALVGGVAVVARALRRRVFAILAVVLFSVGLLLVGIETVVSLHLSGALRLSWSLLVFGCAVPLVGLLFYIQYRMKITSDELRKIFHL